MLLDAHYHCSLLYNSIMDTMDLIDLIFLKEFLHYQHQQMVLTPVYPQSYYIFLHIKEKQEEIEKRKETKKKDSKKKNILFKKNNL